MGITQKAVVYSAEELIAYIDELRALLPGRALLIQEYLTGPEYSVGMIGNPGLTSHVLPVLEVDYSDLQAGLPKILSYESKWLPDSPYWTQIKYHEARIDEETRRKLVDYSSLLFRAAGLPRLRPLRLPRRRAGRDQAAGSQPQPRLVLGRQAQLHG